MQPRRAFGEQAPAQVGDHLRAEAADRFDVVAVAREPVADPARDLGAAGVGEARQLREIADRHDAGHDGRVDAEAARVVAEAQVGVGVVEVLRDRRARAGAHLGREGPQVVVRAARLGVHLGIRRDLDVEPVAGLGAHPGDEIAGVAEVARVDHAGRQVAAQGDDAPDAVSAVGGEQLAYRLAGGAHARQMRRHRPALGGDLEHGRERLLARGPAGAVGDAVEGRREGGQLLAHRAQLVHAGGRVGREEFEAQGDVGRRGHLRAYRKNSRLPSPPRIGLSNHSRTCQPASAAAPSMSRRTVS